MKDTIKTTKLRMKEILKRNKLNERKKLRMKETHKKK